MQRALIVLLLFIILILQYRLWIGDGSLAHIHRLEGQIAQQQAENERIKTQNALLSAQVSALKEGRDAIEERARKQMGMIKEGETFYMIIDEPINPATK